MDLLLIKAKNYDVMINIFTASMKNTFSSIVQRPQASDLQIHEEMVVIISNIASKLKTKQLQTIYNNIITVPERLFTDRVVFSSSIIVKFGIWSFSSGDLQYHIEVEKK